MKRFICILLAAVMTIGAVPAAAFAEDEPVKLDGVGISLQDGFDSTGVDFVAFGASGVSEDNQAIAEYALPESGRYSITIHRTGDLSLESTIMVGTLDVSAKYGKDYKILKGDYVIEEAGPGKTVMEMAMDPANRVDENALSDAEISNEQLEAAEPEQPETQDTGTLADDEKSPLALLKEQQTGKPTRETSGEAVSPAKSIMDSIGLNPIDVLDPSALIGLVFAPGETEKEIVFEIINDSESEGREVFDLDISTLDENTNAVSPYTCSIVIEDDEPVEHSTVNLAAAKYTAENDEAVITIERKGADYTYATVKIRTVADGNAREGLDFAAIDMELEFLPNQMETSITIPTVAGQYERDLHVELYEALGCKLGKKTTAVVVIPEKPSESSIKSGTLAESGGYKVGSTFTVENVDYKLAALDGSSAFKIIANSNVGERYVGIFYPPSYDYFKYGRSGDDPNSSAKWEYSSGGIEGESGPVGYLYWYSNFCGDYGGCYAYNRITTPWIFQTAYMDIKTDSALNSVNMGFVGQFNDKNGKSIKGKDDHRSSESLSRRIKGPATTFMKVREGEFRYAGTYDGERFELHANAYRNGFSAGRPEVWFWGTPCFFREFYITQSDPAQMEYVTVDADGNMSTTKRIPAQVRMLTTNGRYLYERVTFVCTPYESGVIGGSLVGFNIKPNGSDKVIFRANESEGGDDGFTIDEVLLKEIDKSGAIADKLKGNHYVNTLDVTPVFQYKDVEVELIEDTSDDGKPVGSFTYENEIKTREWHVGDEIPMAAAPGKAYTGRYSYQTYLAYGCANPGDPQSAYAEKYNPDRYEDHKSFTLSLRKYYITTEFTDEGNYIAIKLDEDAEKYFAFKSGDILTDHEIAASSNTSMKQLAAQGYKILKISDAAGAKMYTPTPSMAYSIRLVETMANAGKYRPVFSNSWAEVSTQGFSFDLLASALPSRNIITVSAEKVDQSAYRYMVLEGKVQYSSVSMRDSSQDLRNVPAENVAIYGNANPIDGAVPGTSMVRISATSDQDGAFSINGVRAIPGDTISVLCQHEGVWQVRYFKLPLSAMEEVREINVGSYDPKTGKVQYELKNENAMIVDLLQTERSYGGDPMVDEDGIIDLPIRTNYTPYIRNFYFAHSNYPKGSTMGNTCEIVDQDSIIFNIEVETNGVEVSAVKMRFMRNGAEQFVEKATPSAPNSKIYVGTVSSDRLVPGYKLEFQIESPEKNKAQFDTEGVEKDQEVDKIFPSIDSGLSFYVPDEAMPSQELAVDFPDELGKMPMLGSITQSVGSGKIIYQVDYEDPADPQAGYRFNTVGLSIDIDVDQAHREKLVQGMKDKLNSIKSTGGSKPAQEAQQSYPDRAAAERAARQSAAYEDIDLDPQYDTPEKKQAAKDAWDADNPVKDYQETAYKNGLVQMADNKVTVGLTLLLRFEFLYDEDADSWAWVGTQLLLNVYVAAAKTFPTVIYGIPVYLYVGGKISVTLEFAFNFDDAEGEEGLVMRRRIKEMEKKSGNITPIMSSASPWITVAGTITMYGGVGVNGIVSIRGVGNVDLAVKFNFDERWDPNFGFTWGAQGGYGFDALLVSANIILAGYQGLYGAIYKVTPTFRPESQLSGGSGKLSGNVISAAENAAAPSADVVLRSLDMGSETYNAFGDGSGSLSSTLVPSGEKDIISGTLEYIRPVVIELYDNHFMLVFLRNMEGGDRDEANASGLCYAIGTKTKGADGKETVNWGNIREIEKDASFDTMPAALKIGDDVYIAWSTAKATGNTDVASVKSDLQDMDVHIAKLKKSSGYSLDTGFGDKGILRVSNDNNLNCNVRLVNESGNIAVYYLKKDLSKVKTEEELLDFQTNYSTWARTLVSPAGEIIKQKSGAGQYVNEYMIPIEHPTLTDPFVADYMVGIYRLSDARDYRITVYTVAKDETSGKTELWAKVDNLTDGRSFYPIKISEGSESLSQPQLTSVRRKAVINKEGNNGIVDDLMLTWITDGTKLHTISAHDVFNAIQYEDGAIPDDNKITGTTTSLLVLRSLTEAERALSNWPERAGNKMLDSIKDERLKDQFELRYPVLNALSDTSSWMEDLGTVKDFGKSQTRTTINDSEESYSTGLTLESYRIVSGDDNNIYLFWTWPLSVTGGTGSLITGNEIWGSSYETDVKYDQDAQADPGSNNSRGWSDPVMVTDYALRADAADYPNGRVLDELCPIIGTDSGALILGNAYSIGYGADGDLVYGRHNLTEIVCESEGSLKVEDIHLEDPSDKTTDRHPIPSSKGSEPYNVSVTIKNDGLLPARDYTFSLAYSADGAEYKEVKTYTASGSDGDEDTIYAGESNTIYVEGFEVPDYKDDLKLRLIVQEYKPGTKEPYTSGGEVVKDRKEVDLRMESILDFSPVYRGQFFEASYMTEDQIAKLTDQFGSTKESYNARLLEMLGISGTSFDVQDHLTSFDARSYYLYSRLSDLNALLEDFDKATDQDHELPFVAFIPVRNNGNKASGKLEVEIVKETYKTNAAGEKETSSTTVGMTSCDPIKARDLEFIPVVVKLKPDMINDLGGCLLRVHVSIGGKRVDGDNIVIGFRAGRNVKLLTDTNDAVHKITTDASGAKTLSLKKGDSVPFIAKEYPFSSKGNISIRTYNSSAASKDPVIGLDANSNIKALKEGTAFIEVFDPSSDGLLTETIKVTVSDSGSGGGSSGGGSSGGGSSSGGSSGGGGGAVTPAKPAADGTTTTTTNNADGGKTETTKTTDGTQVAVTTDKSGNVTSVEATVSKTAAEEAAKTGDAVVLPTTAGKGTAIKVDVPDGTTVDVAIPTAGAKTSTVVYVVRSDGTEEILKDCDVQNGIVSAKIDSDCTLVVRDNEQNYRDVESARWSKDAIDYVTSRRIMNGNGDGTFTPFEHVSRGMMAQVLYNLDRNAAPGNAGRFKDSDKLLWFGDSVGWAADAGIVTGNPDGSFGVNDDIDREQTVTMLYRYANRIGLDTAKRASLSAFPDAGSVRAYSKDAMEWAVAVGLINGDEGKINPEGSADREQLATMVMRFVKLMHKK